MENTREYRHIDLVDDEKKAERLAKQPTYRAHHIFHENLFAVERYQNTVQLDKPIYTGAAVLELRKLLMLDFHYDFIKKHYPAEKSVLGFTDTDSLLYSIETPNIYDDIRKHHEEFDVSNYPNNHPIFVRDSPETVRWLKNKNKKVVGKMKDEAGGDRIIEFVGLRAKAYSYIQEEYDEKTKTFINAEVKKLKGIKRNVVKRLIHFENYKNCLYSGKNEYVSMVTFRSKKHKLQTIEQVKKALSRFDDKRFILSDGITTRAHGHTDNIFECVDI